MQAIPALPSDGARAAHECPRCLRYDTIPMPMANLLDKLADLVNYAPFKCRACRAKFYRRPHRIPASPPPAVARAPVRNVAARRRDRADTLRRLEAIIRTAGTRRPRKTRLS
jgi:hypothetical protein